MKTIVRTGTYFPESVEHELTRALTTGDIIFTYAYKIFSLHFIARTPIKAVQFIGKHFFEPHSDDATEGRGFDHKITHTAICVVSERGLTIRESIGSGVREITLRHFLLEYPGVDFLIFRPTFSFLSSRIQINLMRFMDYYTKLGTEYKIPYSSFTQLYRAVRVKRVEECYKEEPYKILPEKICCSSFINWAYNNSLKELVQNRIINKEAFDYFCIPYEDIAPMHLFHELRKKERQGLFSLIYHVKDKIS